MDTFVADGIYIDTPPEQVFQGLLNAEDILIWFDAKEVSIDPQEGGQLKVSRWDGSEVSGTIKNMNPPEKLEIQNYYWKKDGVQRGPMQVSFELMPKFGGVWIMVQQSDLDHGDDWKKFAQATLKEWRQSTLALKRHIDGI